MCSLFLLPLVPLNRSWKTQQKWSLSNSIQQKAVLLSKNHIDEQTPCPGIKGSFLLMILQNQDTLPYQPTLISDTDNIPQEHYLILLLR